MSSLAGPTTATAQFDQTGFVRRIDRWLHAMPHPSVAVEIAAGHVAAARANGRGHLDDVAAQSLPGGAVMPSAVEVNVTQPETVRSALRHVLNRVPDRGAPVALLIPDPVVRVFILPFDTLPRRSSEALPLLRWRLKKSVPFDVEETVVSWTRQAGRDGNLEVVAAVARRQIVREYEEIVEFLGAHAGVVVSSTLAALSLLEGRAATLLARLCGKTLTTAIIRGMNLCVYRSTEMAADIGALEPQAVLDEIFPAVAYFQDTWGASIESARLAGFGERQAIFGAALAGELNTTVGAMADAEGARGLDGPARDLVRHGLDGLAGWASKRSS
ncbi:MAG TPA: hypothetical protein VJO53_11400 [Candidatus Acidoferrales bacterium]|nr:hypothetical protein [Candidatus Acidoferrales bacterium]